MNIIGISYYHLRGRIEIPKGSEITKKQHYIPQVYLRGFSPEYGNNDIPVSKHTVFCHDLTGRNQFRDPIPIKSICYEKDLYEVTGRDGEIVLPNHLEHFFSIIENMFGKYRCEHENKAFLEENYKTKCFLTNEEKAFWMTYIIIQMLRMPKALQLAENLSLKIWENEINTKQAKNIARMYCLPFFREMEENNSEELAVFNALLNPMVTMTFGVGVDRQAKIITSDKPIYVYAQEVPCTEYKKIIFPISAKVCLFLYGEEYKKKIPKNFLFPINDGIREEIFKSMTDSSYGKIYSNHVLDKKEQRYIEEVLREKEER